MISNSGEFGYLLTPPNRDWTLPGMIIPDLMPGEETGESTNCILVVRASNAYDVNDEDNIRYTVLSHEKKPKKMSKYPVAGKISRINRKSIDGHISSLRRIHVVPEYFHYSNASMLKNSASLNRIKDDPLVWWNAIERMPRDLFDDVVSIEVKRNQTSRIEKYSNLIDREIKNLT